MESPGSAAAPQRSPRRALRKSLAGRLLAVLGSAAVIGFALTNVGGTYALWSDAASVDAGTVASGSAGLDVAWHSDHEPERWQELLPGESVGQGLTLDNVGDAQLAISARTEIASAGFEVRIVGGACSAAPLDVDAADGVMRAVTSDAEPLVLLAGGAAVVCLEVRATSAATPGETVAFSTVFEGQQLP